MVRTLDFQSKNAGSIPASPNITKYYYQHLNFTHLLKKNTYNNLDYFKKIEYSFYFVSLIPPFLSDNLHFLTKLSTYNKKLLLKQSYILLTWFYYLSFLNSNANKKKTLSFFVFPSINKIFTNVKSPMAHKNWSKEQYKFEFYKINIKFKSTLREENEINSVNAATLFTLISKKNFPHFETNLFFLKYYRFLFIFYDNFFFNYYRFIKK
jgi:hypothetical protein